jgi:hypothetical protein
MTCRCGHQLREWKEKQSMRDKLEDAFARLRHAFEADDYTPMEDVIEAVLQRFTGDLHLVSENSRLRAENAALREACTLALGIMEQNNRVTVLPTAKFVDVKFAPEDIAVLREAIRRGLADMERTLPKHSPKEEATHD